jgi:predicted nuclease of predicted toxin-antitoxin system
LKLHDFSFLTDENINPAVVASLRARGYDVLDVREEGWCGAEDATLLRFACSSNRVVVTHDSDFGGLSVARLEPVVGIVFLRPGHIDPKFTLDALDLLFKQDIEVSPPFLIVAKRTGSEVTIRLRRL